jgi:hypothetical protein
MKQILLRKTHLQILQSLCAFWRSRVNKFSRFFHYSQPMPSPSRSSPKIASALRAELVSEIQSCYLDIPFRAAYTAENSTGSLWTG